MAMRKLLSKRLFNISNGRISSVGSRVGKDLRRLLHNSGTIRAEIMQMPVGESLVEKLREMDGSKDRIRLEGLAPPNLTVEDTKDAVKTKLRESGKSWMPYAEFVSVCGEVSSDPDLGSRIARMLDDSAHVIVLGDSVCLRPDQVTKSIQALLPLPNDSPRIEFRQLQAQKAVIDVKAHSLVRRELWAGLAYVVLQTAGFMRLTFWELSWDVMEPICFYVTSIYFMAGYAFFLRTSKEPSFEGFYHSRFEAKQRKLMCLHEFDVERYNQLKMLFFPEPSERVSKILGTIKS